MVQIKTNQIGNLFQTRVTNIAINKASVIQAAVVTLRCYWELYANVPVRNDSSHKEAQNTQRLASTLFVFLAPFCGSITRVTLHALKVADITQVDWMFERLVALMAGLTFPICKPSKVDRMLKRLGLHRRSGSG